MIERQPPPTDYMKTIIKKEKKSENKGFTLIELIVAIFIFFRYPDGNFIRIGFHPECLSKSQIREDAQRKRRFRTFIYCQRREDGKN